MTTPPPPPPPSAPPPPPAGVIPPSAAGSGILGKRRSAGLVILLSIVTFGIWTIVWSYQNGDELKRWSGRGLGGLGYLFLTMLLAPVTMFMLAGEVEDLYRRDGRKPPITAIWGLWFLLPIVGSFIWYFRMQRSINDYWSAHGQTTSGGL